MPTRRGSTPPSAPTPRPHQDAALDALVPHFRPPGARGQFISACGSGKTLTAAWLVKRLGFRRVVVIAPSLLILHQTAAAWRSVGLRPTLIVCSDPSVGETVDDALLVTTDADDVSEHCDGARWIILATYQSADLLGAAMALARVSADILICDEAHHLAGREGRPFSIALSNDNLAARRRLFQTATPRVLGRRSAKEREAGAWSMDDEAAFGPVVHRLSFGAAIDAGILCDWSIAAVAVPPPGLTPDQEDEREAAVHQAMLAAIAAGDIRSVIMFRHTRRGARVSAELVRIASERNGALVPSDAILGDAPTADRLVRLGRIAAAGGVAVTARALGEGVDAPAVDAVAFVDTRTSVVDIVQAVGRALRRDPARPDKMATVLIPVILGPDGAPSTDGLDALLDVLRAMRAHDDRLAATIDRLAAAGNPDAGGGALSDDTSAFLRAHGLAALLDGAAGRAMLWYIADEVADRFAVGMAHLDRFVAEHGHAKVKQGVVVDGFKLGRWLTNVKSRHNQGRALPDDLVGRLAALPGWTWQMWEEAWTAKLDALRAYHAEHGHYSPSADQPDERGLALWIAQQRADWRLGCLKPPRVVALESLPGWTWTPPRGPATHVRVKRWAAATDEQRREHGRRVMEGRRARGKGVTSGRRRDAVTDPEEVACTEIEAMLWPDGPVCPHCGECDRVYPHNANPQADIRIGLRSCGACGKQFTVRVGTVMEDSKIPLTKWLAAFRMMSDRSARVPALKLQRDLGIGSYRTALLLHRRLSFVLSEPGTERWRPATPPSRKQDMSTGRLLTGAEV